MCLGVPGLIVSLMDENPLTRTGKVNFGGILKEVNLSLLPEARVGDYVIVHVGIALSKIDEKEANKVFEYLNQIDELKELQKESL